MAGSRIRTDHAVNFRLPNKQKLLAFIDDWEGIEVSRMFLLTVCISHDRSPHLVQVVPNGKTANEDACCFDFLDASLRDGMLAQWGWTQYAECLPRLDRLVG